LIYAKSDPFFKLAKNIKPNEKLCHRKKGIKVKITRRQTHIKRAVNKLKSSKKRILYP
jgi:hypothetical protein